MIDFILYHPAGQAVGLLLLVAAGAVFVWSAINKNSK